jgi:hypothetical protein
VKCTRGASSVYHRPWQLHYRIDDAHIAAVRSNVAGHHPKIANAATPSRNCFLRPY